MLKCKLVYTKRGSKLIKIFHKKDLIATFKKDNESILEYINDDIKNSISLSLPNTQKFYLCKNMIPYFDSFLPEGYLFEIFKNYLTKEYGYIDDFLLLKFLAPNIESRINYKTTESKLSKNSISLDIENILQNDTKDTFVNLLKIFFDKNSISGVQPKTIAILKDKEKLNYKNYIVKTWGDEFIYLAENEYLTMKTVELAGVKIPNIYLSKNKNFLIIERFDSVDIGFEEIISLMDKTKIQKYSGSYEQVSKVIYRYISEPISQMQIFFKLIVMNFLLKNADAHLKNFGLIYSDDFAHIQLSPAYDIVTTTAYIFNDKPALMLDGKRIWYGRDKLLEFGIKNCYLKEKDAQKLFDECIEAVKLGIDMVQKYISKNSIFETIGKKMIDSWKLSLDQKTYKEMPLELTRTWHQNKRT